MDNKMAVRTASNAARNALALALPLHLHDIPPDPPVAPTPPKPPTAPSEQPINDPPTPAQSPPVRDPPRSM
ncbi:hypothetical protein ACFJGW_19735 [Burkholderiaceae bacterium UC74_6]